MPDETPGISDKILNRVRSLLAKAESSEHAAEKEAFQTKAFELMSAYGIERAMLAARGGQEDPVDALVIEFERGAYVYCHAYLAQGIAQALGAPLAIRSGERGRGKPKARITIVATASTRERIEFLYTILLAQAVVGMAGRTGRDSGETIRLRRGFHFGFAERVGERLAEVEQRLRAQATTVGPDGATTGTALVLADRDALVAARFAQMFPTLRTGPALRVDAEAHAEGRRAGETADLGGARFGGSRTAELTAG